MKKKELFIMRMENERWGNMDESESGSGKTQLPCRARTVGFY